MYIPLICKIDAIFAADYYWRHIGERYLALEFAAILMTVYVRFVVEINKEIESMFTVIGLMVFAIFVGFLFRKCSFAYLGKITTFLIWMLLFILGIEVGGNRRIMEGLHTLGLEALLVAAMCVMGSCFSAWILGRVLYGKRISDIPASHPSDNTSESLWKGLKGSMTIVAFFLIGVFIGLADIFSFDLASTNVSFYALCCLMVSVGLGLGSDPDTLRNFRNLNPRLVFLPFMTIAGTLAGAFLASFVLSHRSPAECMALGSGMGYYSLSSIFITEYKGAELGTIALLANVIREIMTLLGAPFMVRIFGRLAPISAGGATTMDTTLPIISRYSGQDLVIVSIFHGFLTDFSVPFLVSFFCLL